MSDLKAVEDAVMAVRRECALWEELLRALRGYLPSSMKAEPATPWWRIAVGIEPTGRTKRRRSVVAHNLNDRWLAYLPTQSEPLEFASANEAVLVAVTYCRKNMSDAKAWALKLVSQMEAD